MNKDTNLEVKLGHMKISEDRPDNVKAFPREVLELIFRHVDSSHTLHLVCKQWCQVALEVPQCYSNLALKSGISYSQYQSCLAFYRRIPRSSIDLESLTIPTAQSEADFWAILKDVLHNEVSFKQLHITSTQFCSKTLFELLRETNFKCVKKLSSLEALTVVDRFSGFFNDALIRLSRKLKRFELINVTAEGQCSEEQLNEYYDLKQVAYDALCDPSMPRECNWVKSLTLITRWKEPVFRGENYYTRVQLPSDDIFSNFMHDIETLVIVGMYLRDMRFSFHEYIWYVHDLKHLYFEQNFMWFLPNFLKIMEFPTVTMYFNFQLESFTFREVSCGRAQDLEDFVLNEPPYKSIYLEKLRKLDLYGSSLTSKGLRKFLSLCGNEIHLLNLGNSKHLFFEGTLDDSLRWTDLLKKCVGLKELFLPGSNLNGRSLKLLNLAIKELGEEKFRLETLDLSFCDLDEQSLLSFFESSIEEYVPRVERLVLDGMVIPEATISKLKEKGYARNVVHDETKSNWRVYGENSLITEEMEYGDSVDFDDDDLLLGFWE